MMDKTKVLILETSIFNGTPGGGSSIQAKYYEKLLSNEGFSVCLFTGQRSKSGIYRAWEVFQKARETDLIVGFGTPFLGTCLQWLAFFTRKKGVLCIDTVIIVEKVLADYLRHRAYSPNIIVWCFLEALLYRILYLLPVPHSLRIITTCQYLEQKLKKWPLVPESGKYLHPEVMIRKAPVKSFRQKTILFYGALYWGRGVIDLVKACSILWKKGCKFKLMVLGYPIYPLTKKLFYDLVKREGNKLIVVKEKVSSPEKFVQAASGVVIPFRFPCSFQQPLTLLEPMALGVPVITTDVGANGEWIQHEQTGLICCREDPEDIARQIERILYDESLTAKITNNAEDLVRERYKRENLIVEILRSDCYAAREKYSRLNPVDYERDRFTGASGEAIDSVEKDAIAKLLGRNGRSLETILDIATGPGRLAFYLEGLFGKSRICAVDINKNMLSRATGLAKKRGSKVKFFHGDIYKLPFADNTFDVVAGLRFSVHLPHLKRVLEELNRVLKKDGTLIFDVFNPQSILFFRNKEGYYSLKKIKNLAKDTGFVLTDYLGILSLGETLVRKLPFTIASWLMVPFLGRFSTKLVCSFRKIL